MNEELAGFRELEGVDAAAEARLHASGVRTWEALSEVLDVLSRLGAENLRELADLVATHRSGAPGPPDAPDRLAAAAPAPADGSTAREPQDGSPTPAPASRHHLVVLDAGKVIGGTSRSVDLAVSTAALTRIGRFAYSARLTAHPVGAAGAGPVERLGTTARMGQARPPERIRLRFDDVALPAGVQRLRLHLTVVLPDPIPADELPALQIEQPSGAVAVS